MRRLALLALAGTLACGEDLPELQAGPRDGFTFPSGLGVLDRRLLVVSSNADLAYASETGGSVIAVDVCDPVLTPGCLDAVTGALNVESFAGELGVADPATCPALAAAGKGAAAVVPVRGTNLVYRLAVDAAGALSCDGCEIPVGSGERGDPFSVGIACGPGIARAYVGYLRSSSGRAWLTEIDLTKDAGDEGYVRHRLFNDTGAFRGFAYDAARSRLYLTRTVSGAFTQIRWVDLAGGCRLDEPDLAAGGCRTNATRLLDIPTGLELRSIALASAPAAGAAQRVYVSARIYDPNAANAAGVRVGDFDGLIVVGTLAEDLTGQLRFSIVDQIPIGYGAGDLRLLPPRAGKRDLVAALASDDGVLWIYDDETGGRVRIGRHPDTGAPLVGRGPFPLAVDPDPIDPTGANVARLYVGSFRESFVTPIDVPLDAPETAGVVMSGTQIRRVGPRVTP